MAFLRNTGSSISKPSFEFEDPVLEMLNVLTYTLNL